MIFSSGSAKPTTRRAAACVEFAIIAPVLFTMIIGIIECANMLMVQEIIVNAAREGARQSTLPGAQDPPIDQTITNYLSAAGINPAVCTITLTPALASGPASGTPMTTTISVPCASVSWVPLPEWFNGLTLSATVIMIKQ